MGTTNTPTKKSNQKAYMSVDSERGLYVIWYVLVYFRVP
jgi:hypothetical protein